MRPLHGLNIAQRFFSFWVEKEAACVFQLCHFPNCKDKLEGLAGHFSETVTLSFYLYTTVQAITTKHIADLRQPREKLPQEIALQGGKSSRSFAQWELLLLNRHH